ncbi:hypothetical protein M0R45_000115 [Rubus argutus]|uniref:Acid phosphatase 1 n=1 Tax=Rubus argutus TaxID=59490 RepID=A0AAW1VR11_RUBAR
MGRNLSLFLCCLSFFVTLAVAESEWNILNQRTRNLMKISLKNYCESWRMNVELHNIREFQVVPEECIGYIGTYVTSTQYKVDSERAIEECVEYLSTSCNLKKDGRDAWIFDIDDTLLSTVPFYKRHHSGWLLEHSNSMNQGQFLFWVQGSDDEVKGLQNYKADVREQLMGGGYSNWGILGDQYSSIEGLPRTKRTFKLPNPLYYVS